MVTAIGMRNRDNAPVLKILPTVMGIVPTYFADVHWLRASFNLNCAELVSVEAEVLASRPSRSASARRITPTKKSTPQKLPVGAV